MAARSFHSLQRKMHYFKTTSKVSWAVSRHVGTCDASVVKQYLAKPSDSAAFDGTLLIHQGRGLSEGHSQAVSELLVQGLKAAWCYCPHASSSRREDALVTPQLRQSVTIRWITWRNQAKGQNWEGKVGCYSLSQQGKPFSAHIITLSYIWNELLIHMHIDTLHIHTLSYREGTCLAAESCRAFPLLDLEPSVWARPWV